MMRLLRTIQGWLFRLLPIALGVVGWRVAHWFGMLVGLFVGAILAIAFWLGSYYLAASAGLRRQRREMADLATERLKELAVDPTSREMPFAMGELKNRGIDARPSLESVCELLVSPQHNRRALGISLLFGLYPKVFAKIGDDASSTDPPEVWRDRLAAALDGGLSGRVQ